MHGVISAFNGLVAVDLVRRGDDEKLLNGEHIFQIVYSEMLLQVCRDYSGLPDPRTLKAHEIRFFYNGLRPELKTYSKPKK